MNKNIPSLAICLCVILNFTTGCGSIFTKKNFQPARLPSTGTPTAEDHYKQASEKWWDKTNGQERTNASRQTKRTFLISGLNLSDEIADKWLKEQYRRDVESRYGKNTFNTVVGLSTAVLGLADAGNKAVTALGAGSASINSQWNNYEATFLLSTALEKVIEELKSFRLALRIKIIEQFDASEPSYIETRDIIDKYHETISRENIKRFIDKSVELAKTVYTQPVDNPLSDPRAIEPNKALFKLVYTNDGAFSLNELVALYARHVYGDSSKIATELGKVDAYKTIFDAHLQNIGTDTAKKQEFAQLMSKLNNYLSLHIKAEAIKKNIEEADPNGNGLVDGTIGSLFPSTIGKINFEPNVISR